MSDEIIKKSREVRKNWKVFGKQFNKLGQTHPNIVIKNEIHSPESLKFYKRTAHASTWDVMYGMTQMCVFIPLKTKKHAPSRLLETAH